LSRYRFSEQSYRRKLGSNPSLLPQSSVRLGVLDYGDSVKRNCRFIAFLIVIGERGVCDMFDLCQGNSLGVSGISPVNEYDDVILCSFTFVPENPVKDALQRVQELLPTTFISGSGRDKAYGCRGNSDTCLFSTARDEVANWS